MLQADHSEKRSIIKLIGMIVNVYAKKHDSLCLRLQVMAIVVCGVCLFVFCMQGMVYTSIVNPIHLVVLLHCQVTDGIVKSAANLYQQLSDDEIQEGVKLMEEGNEKRLQ